MTKHHPLTRRAALRACVAAVLALLMLPQAGFAARGSISYAKRKVLGVVTQVVTINLDDLDVKLTPAVAKHGVGSSESFGSIINRTRPTAAITGTFFDTRSLHPVGDIVVDGEKVCRGTVGTAVGIGWNNEVEFISTQRGRISDWSAFQSVICTGPRLLANGKACVYPKSEGFRDGRMYSQVIRTAVGLTADNKLLFVVTRQPVYLSRLAKVMTALGARNAAALDGGGSTALYYRGSYLRHPQRKLTNLLLAYDNAAAYEQARARLLPTKARLSCGRGVGAG